MYSISIAWHTYTYTACKGGCHKLYSSQDMLN